MQRKYLRFLAPLALVAVIATACSKSDDSATTAAGAGSQGNNATSATGSGGSGAATDTGASSLRAGLTGLLQEHVYLAGITTGTALEGKDFKVPAATLDANSVQLSEAIASVYGDAAGKQFLELWRKHIGFFVDYTVGVSKSDQAMQDKARADLDGYRGDFGAFLASANPNLTKDAVATALVPHVDSLFAAIDAQGAQDPSAFDKLKEAASHMPSTADVLAGAIAKQHPDKFAA